MTEELGELFSLLWRNRLRTGLTALSVAWGIFMLVILLAAGRGLHEGVKADFKDDATNSLWINPGKTSLPFVGKPVGRDIVFDNGDVPALQRHIPGIERITGRFFPRGTFSVRYREKSGTFDVRGCHPDHLHLEKTLLLSGRFINERDLRERRKVAVIGPEVKSTLFGDKDPIGEFIEVGGANYRIVGLYTDEGEQGELRKIYVPISTAQLVYHGQDHIHQLMFTVASNDVNESRALVDKTRQLLGQRHAFDPRDARAVRVHNNLEAYMKVTQVFDWIGAFVWLVGIGTLLAGMVGVGNIMLISVRERTVEFGIRKAIGATPAVILRSVLIEALLVTTGAGYLGLVVAAGVVEALAQIIPDNEYFTNPSVDFGAALGATLLLIVTGALAGLVPALRAARVKPAIAMRGS